MGFLDDVLDFDIGGINVIDPMDLTGRRRSRAAGNLAKAQEAAAAPSSRELKALDEMNRIYERNIQLSEANLSRQENILNTIDPSIVESGNQLLQLLQGGDSRFLDPVKRQRTEQRGKMENRLREELGSGYASSAAGMQALQNFDQQTAYLIAQKQEGGLSTMSNLFGALQGYQGNAVQSQFFGQNQAQNSLVGILNAENALKTRALPHAGSQFVQPYMQAQYMNQLGNDAIKMGIAGATGGSSLAVTGAPGQQTQSNDFANNFYTQPNPNTRYKL